MQFSGVNSLMSTPTSAPLSPRVDGCKLQAGRAYGEFVTGRNILFMVSPSVLGSSVCKKYLALSWFIVPHYGQIYCLWSGLDMLHTCSLLLLKLVLSSSQLLGWFDNGELCIALGLQYRPVIVSTLLFLLFIFLIPAS